MVHRGLAELFLVALVQLQLFSDARMKLTEHASDVGCKVPGFVDSYHQSKGKHVQEVDILRYVMIKQLPAKMMCGEYSMITTNADWKDIMRATQ